MKTKTCICKACNKNYEIETWRKPSFYCSRPCQYSKASTWLLKTSFKIDKATQEEKLSRLKDNYEKLVIRSDGCWGWKGQLERGYPKMTCRKSLGANLGHRASWIIHKGLIPKGMSILHKCDNRSCTNINHLFLGTHQDNVNDMITKKRNPIGSKVGTSKLNEDQVKEIKNLLKIGRSLTSIADKFDVTPQAIYLIRQEKNWKHVEV